MKRLILFGLIVLSIVVLGYIVLDDRMPVVTKQDRIPEAKKIFETKVGDPNAPAPDGE